MATTDLIGLPAEYSSEPALGMAGDAAGAGVVGDTAGTDAADGATVADSTVAVASMADAVLWAPVASRTARLEVFTVAWAAVSTGQQAEASMVAEVEDSTAVAAGIDKLRSCSNVVEKSAGSKPLPAVFFLTKIVS
jgi:hypothetical protein